MNNSHSENATTAGGSDNGPIKWFATNSVAANLLMLLFIVGGLVVGGQLAFQQYPEPETRYIRVNTKVPGASPEQIMQDVNRRIEEAIIGIRGVERVKSTAYPELGVVEIKKTSRASLDELFNNVESTVHGLVSFPPIGAEPPEIAIWRWSITAMTLAVTSSTANENSLRKIAERLHDNLIELPSVTEVELQGIRDREITVEVGEELLAKYRLTLRDVAHAISGNSTNLSLGQVHTDSGVITLQALERRDVGREFRDIPLISKPDGTLIRLGDIAKIRDDFSDEQAFARIDGSPAILLRILASAGQSVDEIGAEVMELLDGYELPPESAVQIWHDRASTLDQRFSAIYENAAIGLVLVFLSLALVFDLRAAFWISFGIPFSFVGALMLFGVTDLTLNLVTLMAFFLMIGIVVDDAIVVGEGIMAARQEGLTGSAAAVSGARSMFAPIAAGTLTTIVAFSPFFMLTEGNWTFLRAFPIVAICVLAVSTIEAFLILPAHLSRDRPWSMQPLKRVQVWTARHLETLRDLVVLSGVTWSMRNPWISISIAAGLLVFSVLLVRLDVMSLRLYSADFGSSDYVQFDISLPAGTPIATTEEVAERVAEAALRINVFGPPDPIQSVSILVGEFAIAKENYPELATGTNLASVRAHIADDPDGAAKPRDISVAWLKLLGDLPELVELRPHWADGQLTPLIVYAVQHDDWKTAKLVGQELTDLVRGIDGLFAVSNNIRPGKREFDIKLTPAGLAAGLSPTSIGIQLRAMVEGIEVQRIQRGRDELRVLVRFPEEERNDSRQLAWWRLFGESEGTEKSPRNLVTGTLFIDLPSGGKMALRDAATFNEIRREVQLKRIDGKLSVMIVGSNDFEKVVVADVHDKVLNEFAPRLEASYPGTTIGLESASRSETEDLEKVQLAFPVVLIAVYALSASLLRSFWMPLVAVATFPICVAGAIYAHVLFGWGFTVASLFGILAAFGVAVNDSLVLLNHYVERCRSNPRIAAIAAFSAAIRSRFRAVFLTTVTTVLGLSPLLFERHEDK